MCRRYRKHVQQWTAIPMVALSLISVAGAEVPQRSDYAMTLEVPAEHAAAGKVFYVVYPAWDAQITFTSDAPLERITGTSNKVVGYAVAEMDGEHPTGRLSAAAFSVPLRTLDTGIPARNGHLQTGWTDAAGYPDITFELIDSKDAKLAKEGEDFKTYELTLIGDMSINGVTRQLTIPARITFMPHNDQTRMRTGGDLLAIRCSYAIDRTEFNIISKRGMPSSRVAEEITLDQFLVMDSVSPEERVAARPNGELRLAAQKFLILLTDLNDVEGGYAYGREVMKKYWDDPNTLNTISRVTVDSPDLPVRDFAFAREATERCNELTKYEHPLYLDTLARVCADMGDIRAALKWQRKAVEHIDESVSEANVAGLKATLEKYELITGGSGDDD